VTHNVRRRGWTSLQLCGYAVALSLILFGVESSISHGLVLSGLGDTRPTLRLWLEYVSLYGAIGIGLAALPALASLGLSGERLQPLWRSIIVCEFLLLYAVVVQIWRADNWEWHPLVNIKFLVSFALSATFVQYLKPPAVSALHRRSITFATEFLTWATLLYLSLGPLVILNTMKGSLSPSRNAYINMVVASGCLAVAIALAWFRSAPSRVSSAVAVSERTSWSSPRLAALGLASYLLVTLAALQPSWFSFLRYSVWSKPTYADRRPDLLLIIVDSLRADRLGAYGSATTSTPHLDAFASESIRYADHMSAAPWTYPSVATLFTGHSPGVHGARRLSWPTNPAEQPGIPQLAVLAPTLPTLATILKSHGYSTAFIGSNWLLSRVYGFGRGFDIYSDPLSSDFYVTLGIPFSKGTRGYRGVDAANMTDRFIDYFRNHDSGPTALIAHYMDTHLPYNPPERFRRESEGGEASRTALYDGAVEYVDEQFGRVWEFLRATGRANRTVVAVTSDHGEALERRTSKNDDSVPVPQADAFVQGAVDHGHTMYQELLHVPFLLYGPQVRPRVEHSVTRGIDVLPTILAALRLPVPASVEGRNVLNEIDASLPALSEAVLYGLEKKSWREGHYKLIYKESYPPGREYELYDLLRDPHELRNLAFDEPSRVTLLAGRLRDYLQALPAASTVVTVPEDRDLLQRLRSLGYVK
jgi:arylsulfatase A-like enzyme